MKRLILFLLISLAGFAQYVPVPFTKTGGGGGQVTLFSDTFSGTAGTVLHTYNSTNWIQGNGSFWNDCRISTPNGGVTSAGGACGDYVTGYTWTSKQFVQATLTNLPSDLAFICVQFDSSGNAYCAGDYPDITSGYFIYKYTAGTSSQLVACGGSPANGDVMNFSDVSGLLTLKVNGSEPGGSCHTTDSTFTTGNPGLIIQQTSSTNILSVFSAGSD